MLPYYWLDSFGRGSGTLLLLLVVEMPATLQGIPNVPQLEHGMALSHLICCLLDAC